MFIGTRGASPRGPVTGPGWAGGPARPTMPEVDVLDMQYDDPMKTITINVSEPVYAEYRRAARVMGRPTSELIREAMEAYRRSHLAPRADLRQLVPVSLGRVLRPLSEDDDLLDEMLDER